MAISDVLFRQHSFPTRLDSRGGEEIVPRGGAELRERTAITDVGRKARPILESGTLRPPPQLWRQERQDKVPVSFVAQSLLSAQPELLVSRKEKEERFVAQGDSSSTGYWGHRDERHRPSHSGPVGIDLGTV